MCFFQVKILFDFKLKLQVFQCNKQASTVALQCVISAAPQRPLLLLNKMCNQRGSLKFSPHQRLRFQPVDHPDTPER